jgi:hypothetical protein
MYDKEDEYANNPKAYNSSIHKHAYQYTALVLWEGINYHGPYYTCVENGVRALFRPLNVKTMGYKNDCRVEFVIKY